MDEETQKIIAEQMKKMPKDVSAAIISVDYKTKLQEITKRQRLLIDQAGKLEMETTLVMIGLEPLADYVSNLQRELDITLMRAKEISLDVSENIFKPIRDSLRAMNEEAESEEAELETKIPTANTTAPQDIKEATLNRDQILNEIEDPSTIGKELVINNDSDKKIETLDEIPYQQDIKINTGDMENAKENITPEKIVSKPSLLETKMGGMTITSQQIVEAAPEVKLPPVEKRRPFGGVDPYREEIK